MLERPAEASAPLDVLPQQLRDRLAVRQLLVGLVGWLEPITATSDRFADFIEDLVQQRGPLERLGLRCADLDQLIRSSEEPTLAQMVATAWKMPLHTHLAEYLPESGRRAE